MYGISFIQERCIQCHACEIACKIWRKVEPGVHWRWVETIWHGRYPQITSTSTSKACLHCEDPACAEVCPEQAIVKRSEDGIVSVDQRLCTGCRACYEACPQAIPRFGQDGFMQKCDLCFTEIDLRTEAPPCVVTCPVKALVFNKES